MYDLVVSAFNIFRFDTNESATGYRRVRRKRKSDMTSNGVICDTGA